MLQAGMVFAVQLLDIMITLKNKIELIEKEEIIKALEECDHVMARAAKKLGITERIIGYKIRKYKISIRKREN